jgi:hypothetical protein
MWSAAYGLIALAVVAFVALYAAAHAPSFKTVNSADQVYDAKKWLAQHLPSVFKVYERERFRGHTNVAWVRYKEGVHLPLGFRLERARGDVRYQIHLEVAGCRYVALPRGGPVVLYEVELMHSLDQLPWLSVYAAVPRNATQYYSWLYNYYTWGRPPTVGLTPRVGADVDAGLVEWTKVEWALVYDAASGAAKLYAAAPPSALYIVVEDYPLAIPLACPPR